VGRGGGGGGGGGDVGGAGVVYAIYTSGYIVICNY